MLIQDCCMMLQDAFKKHAADSEQYNCLGAPLFPLVFFKKNLGANTLHEFSSISYIISVGGGGSEGCSSQSDPFVGSVVDRVKSFEESLAVDEVVSYSSWGAKVTNNQVNMTGNTTNSRVKVTRPDLSIGRQFKGDLFKKDIQAIPQLKRP